MLRRLHRPLIIVVASLLGAGNASAAEAGDVATREVMHKVFDAIAYLLPLSVRDAEQASSWDRELIDTKLATLGEASGALVAHAKVKDEEFRYIARSFDETTREIVGSFRETWPSYAYFSLMELTQHCVACHSRLPSDTQAAFGQRLMSRMDTADFDPSELSQLYVATRQFDAAEKVLERKLLSPQEDAIDLDNAGVLLDYLDLALVVRHDSARAQALLTKFAARPDVPHYLADRIEAWQQSLASLAPVLKDAPVLARARELFETADTLTRAPRGRERAIHDLIAASLAQRYIASRPGATGEDIADAYYMLGIIALRTTEPKYSVPEMEGLFAAAIRAAPKGPHARESYDLLEEFGYWRDLHLARAGDDSSIIDMNALRKLVTE
ncbi:MAG: hypothetical protein IT493_04905 [Gammaproteobacteria bacterium]|nr:hypothetical protein [Gammaproteobacteria bacterium]